MDQQPFLDPSKVPSLIAGGMGAFISILFQRGVSRTMMFTTLASAEVVDYYFSSPVWTALHNHFGWTDQWRGPVAFTIGLLAIFLVGGIVKLATDFSLSPGETIGAFIGSILRRVLPRKRED